MTSSEKCQRSLKAYKGHITRAINSCKSVLSSEPVDVDKLETSISFMESKWPVYEAAYMKLENALIDEGDDEQLATVQADYYEVWDDYQNNVVKFKSKLRATKQTPMVPGNTGSGNQSQVSMKPILPVIKLPHFSGDLTEYEAFIDQFQAQVGLRSDLEPVTKLQYLKSQLKGNAYDLIKDIPSVAGNYQHALDSLKETYGDDEKIKHSILNKILEIKPPSHTKKELESFRITLINLTRSLLNKHDYSASEWIIASLFQRKLPSATIRQLYLKYDKNFFTLDQINEGLRDLLSHMEVEEKPKLYSKPSMEPVLDGNDHSNSNTIRSKKDIGTYFTKHNKPVNNHVVNSKKNNCIYCQDRHYAVECDKYVSLADKQARLVELERCPRCVSLNHKLQDCKTVINICRRCERGKHHTALCLKKVKDKKHEVAQHETVNQNVLSIKSPMSTKSTALPTATVDVCNESNHQRICTRAFFDQGSQCTFITKRLVNKLNFKVTGTIRLAVSGFLQSRGVETYQVVRPVIRLGRRVKRITAVVLDNLPDKISVPGLKRAAEKLKGSNILLADKMIESDTIDNIDLVIGADYYGEFINGFSSKKEIKLAKSSGGYLIYGMIPNTEPMSEDVVQNVVVARIGAQVVPYEIQDLVEEADIPVHKLWDLDTIGINVDQPSPEDCLSYQAYLDTVKFEDHQYWVRLPWKINCPSLPTNYNMALGQLKNLTTTLESRDELMFYHEQIQNQLENKFIEVAPKTLSEQCHYIPHHAVKKDSLTTPLRIVFNCSAKRKGFLSLNDCLMTGPSLTEKLGDILLKFRINKYAYSADISKAFLRVGLQECDRDFTRFLWYEDPCVENRALVTYRFKSVLFGATCSPFLLQATLDTHLKRSNNKYKNLLSQNFYVDNFQGTTQCSEQLIEIYENANTELSRANMPLRMWVSNNPILNERIVKDFPDYKVPYKTNILGLCWDISNDSLAIKPPAFVDHSSLSRRKLLSLVSSVFDPLGIFTPVTIRGKLLVREAWKMNVGWDEVLAPSFGEQWSQLAEELKEMCRYEYPRMVGQDDHEYKLHVFCDASSQAYGAVAYLTSDEESLLITSKVRVAPMKGRTIPQLELTALQVGTHLADYIVKTMNTSINETCIWSDNEAALQWLRNDNSNIPYVKNRVRDIKERAANFHYFHVPTKQNPADYLSRGVTWSTLQNNSLWFSGPLWLCKQEEWPCQKEHVVSLSSSVVPEAVTPAQTELFKASDISSLNKIINVTNNVFKFLKALKPSLQLLTPINYWLNIVQRENYKEEYEYLKQNKSSTKLPYLVKSLGLYIDPTSGLIHCRGRLHNSNLSPETKFPVLLPRKSWLSSLLISETHKQVLHGGVSDTLASLRERYWIPKGRQIVKKKLKSCIVCRTIEGRTMKLPGPPPLPEERVVYTKPFETVGIDYTGAITITTNQDDNVARKYYVCLFTCATTRAIHLELARDMSALTFLHLFRRFVARRSSPKLVISDNGSNFTNTAKFLKDLCNDPMVKSHFNNYKIEWKFIPPRSPWMGGFYERLVGVVKNCLRKILFKKKVGEDELITILTEVEMRVNNRPLTYMTDDLDQTTPLTPSHLIHGRRIDSMPDELEDKQDPDFIDTNILNKRYEYLCHILKHWEKVWRREYLSSLREKFYGAQEPDQDIKLQVGDIVIVQTDGTRTSWPLGRITALHPDKSGNVRVVEVLSKGVRSLRTISKLLPLELSCDTTTLNNSEVKDTVTHRPKREAAAKADMAIRNLRDNDLL